MSPSPAGETPLVLVEDLEVHFPVRKGLFGRTTDVVRAVDGVSFTLGRGRTLALVGESGSGKSTTGYAVMGMERPTGGRVAIDGIDRATMTDAQAREATRRMQIVFQDPASALNPRMRVGDCIAEPLRIHGIGTRASRADRVAELLELVGLSPGAATRLPRDFSGGQRQRVVIARALALEPEVIVCDEAVSALDVSIQSQILNLLLALQERLGLAYLFISHDLSVVRHIADDIAVMQHGRIVEAGPVDTVFAAPSSPYTRALIDAVPRLERATRVG
ncbi:ABC transporter ATP-binding protein [Salinarimonas rosea]|uniref:ABC transporter ATP-binding protein n=1 Tax=Salinarimonas rosea TaxID=552063 RepID=UPI00042006C0|nr:ATP-binding cassette domain-containing protein [Salinarimonas rosea]